MQWTLALLTRSVIVIGLLGVLTGCGFQLRGVQDVDASLRQVTLIDKASASVLLQSLRNNMAFNGIEELSGAPYQIQILTHNYRRKSATLSNTDIDEYELSLEVIMLIADREGKPLTSNIRIQRERLYDYDKDSATASGTQEKQLRQELYDGVAQSILRRYLSFKTTK